MGKALINGLIFLMLKIVGLLGSILIYPFQLILVTLFPDLGDLTASALTFINSNIFPALAWLKGFVVNSLSLNPTIVQLIVAELTLYYTAAISIRGLMLIYRLYLFIRGKEI